VADLMRVRGSKTIVAADVTDTVGTALEKMKAGGCGSIIVFEQTAPVGIFTEKDYLVKECSETTPLSKVMTSKIATASIDSSLLDAMHMLANNNIRHLPITAFVGDAIDEDSRIVDVISARDFFTFILATE